MATIALLAAGLTGCAGVPTLYNDAVVKAPRVADIARHLSCELYQTNTVTPLADGHYFVTVLMTLQVDDNIDFTPSLGFIDPLKAASENVTTTVAGDLGGARRRTFTATYTLDAVALRDHGADWCNEDKASKREVVKVEDRRLRLDGKLGLDEVVKDGLEIVAPARQAVHAATSAADKSAPTFGSTIQFTITKSLTGIGPVWTVKRFKGPGGSNGLFNAKRVDTDSVVVTFAPQYQTPPGPTPQQTAAGKQVDAATTATDTAAKTAAQIQGLAAMAGDRARQAREKSTDAARPSLRGPTAAVRSQLAATAEQAETNARSLQDQLAAAQAVEQSTRANLAAARAAQRAADQAAADAQLAAPAGAVNAAQTLQQTMILQNLVGTLPPR